MSLDVTLYLNVDAGGTEPHRCEFFTANITHNLGRMAEEAGIYQCVWRPEECPEIKVAGDIVPLLTKGLKLMESDPERFVKFDSENGWGVYEHFMPWLTIYLAACKQHPKSLIHTCR